MDDKSNVTNNTSLHFPFFFVYRYPHLANVISQSSLYLLSITPSVTASDGRAYPAIKHVHILTIRPAAIVCEILSE